MPGSPQVTPEAHKKSYVLHVCLIGKMAFASNAKGRKLKSEKRENCVTKPKVFALWSESFLL